MCVFAIWYGHWMYTVLTGKWWSPSLYSLIFKQGSYSAPLTYQSYSGDTTFSIQDVRAFVRVANSCEYRLKVECHDATLSAYSYWVTYANEEINFQETVGTFCEYFHLTHLLLGKMVAISQTTFSSAFSWMKMLELRFNFHWNLFLRGQFAINQHWFR